MGLLDSVLGAAQQALGGQAGATGQAGVDWVQLIAGLLSQQGGGQAAGLGGLGGLGALLQQLQQGGLGEQVQSWISTGANLPVSGQQLGSALGGDLLGQLAAQAGVSQAEAGEQLSQWLPQVVDKLSPQGELPAAGAGGMDELLGQLSGLLR